MFELFSTREIAIGIYLLIIIAYAFFSEKIRPSAINLIKAACNQELILPFIIMLVDAGLIVCIISNSSIWDWKYLKDIVMWVILVGVPVCFKAVDSNKAGYFRNIILDNFKFAAINEFVSGTFTFSLIAELIIQPVITFLVLLQTVAEKDEKNKPAKTLIDWVIAFCGALIIYFTIKKAVESYSDLGATDLIVSFCIPIIFSILFLPIAYSLAVYAKYEILFVRMNFKLPSDNRLKRERKLKVIKACGLSYKRVCQFEKAYLQKLYITMPDDELDKLICEFRKEVTPK